MNINQNNPKSSYVKLGTTIAVEVQKQILGGTLKKLVYLFAVLVLAQLSHGIEVAQDTIAFGYPFSDSLTIHNPQAQPVAISNINIEREYGIEASLFFEFTMDSTPFLMGIDRDDTPFIRGPYKKVSEMQIPPGQSIVLSRFNIGHFPLYCTCEDALASHPAPHIFRITLTGSFGVKSIVFKGNVYIRPPNSIKSQVNKNIKAVPKKYRVNGRRISIPSKIQSKVRF